MSGGVGCLSGVRYKKSFVRITQILDSLLSGIPVPTGNRTTTTLGQQRREPEHSITRCSVKTYNE